MDKQYELFLIYLSQIGISFMPLWPYIFTYYGSYCYIFHPDLRYVQVYLVVFFCPVGRISSQVIYPYLFQIFGIKNMYIILGCTELIMSFFAIYFTNFISGCLFLFFKGVIYQGVMNCSNLFLSCKYKNGIYKSKYLMTSRSISMYIWFVYLLYKINPEFKSQNQTNKYGEQFFDQDIAYRFRYFLQIYGVTVFIVLLSVGSLIQNPETFQSRFEEFKQYIQGKISKFEFKEQQKTDLDYSIGDTNSDIQNSSNYISVVSQRLDQKNEQLIDNMHEIQNFETARNLVLKLCVIFWLSMCTNIYHIDSFRYIALYLGFQDQYVSTSFFISTITAFLSTYLATYIQQKYGTKTNLKIMLFNQTAMLILIIISTDFYIISMLFMNAQIAYFFLFNDVFCYSNFDPVQAMKFAKYFLVTCLLGNFAQAFLNYFYFDQNFYTKIYIIFLIGTIFGIIFYYHKIETDEFLTQNQNENISKN